MQRASLRMDGHTMGTLCNEKNTRFDLQSPCKIIMDAIKTSPPITVTKLFDLPTTSLWELISTPGNLNNCHPFCKTNDVVEWSDENHSDVLVYLNGRTYVRRFISWNKNEGYTLRIGEDGGLQSHVEWSIASVGDNQSELTISVSPFILAGVPKIISFLPYQLWVRPKLGKYLNSVLSGFDYYARTGKAVPRNHFGRHSWFS